MKKLVALFVVMFAASASAQGIRAIDATTKAPVDLQATSNALRIYSTGGTPSGYAEDSAHSTGDVGVMSMCVVGDTGATSATAGDYASCMVTTAGELRSYLADGKAVTIGSKADDKNAATDTTAISAMAVWKYISYATQAINTVLGAKADDKSSATDTTAVSAMSVLKYISYAAQALNTVLGTKADDKNSATDTTAISAMAVLKYISYILQNPPSRAVTNAGTFVVQENGAALTALQVIDNMEPVLGAKADNRSTATDTTEVSAISLLKQISYMEQNPSSRAVTNAGTFVVQENGSALTALQLIDDVVYAEDTAHSDANKGVQVLAVRNDAGTTLAGTDGDYGPLSLDANGALRVNPGVTGYAEDAAHTTGDTMTIAGAKRSDTIASTSGTDGDYSPLQVNALGGLYGVQVDGDSAVVRDIVDAIADNLATTLNAAMSASVMYLYDGAALDMARSTATGGLSVGVESWPTAFDAVNSWISSKKTETGTYSPAKTSTGSFTTATAILDSVEVLSYPNFCVYIKNTSANALTDADIQASPDGTDFASLAWTSCDTLAGGATCVYCVSGNAYRYIKVLATSAAGSTTDAWITANKN